MKLNRLKEKTRINEFEQYPSGEDVTPAYSDLRVDDKVHTRRPIEVIANVINNTPGYNVKFTQNVMILTTQRYSSHLSFKDDKENIEDDLKEIISNLQKALKQNEYKNPKFELIEFDYKSVYLSGHGNKMACIATAAYAMGVQLDERKEVIEQAKNGLNWLKLKKNKDYLKIFESPLAAWQTIDDNNFLKESAMPVFITERQASDIGIDVGYYVLTKEGNVLLNDGRLLRGK